MERPGAGRTGVGPTRGVYGDRERPGAHSTGGLARARRRLREAALGHGQGAEFDYSGTQAVKALREEGYEVILINSNPATIMTDPEFADRTYIEPVTPEFVELVIEKERPDALLPTMGGQTALNVAMKLSESRIL